jgi:hypothetical protein
MSGFVFQWVEALLLLLLVIPLAGLLSYARRRRAALIKVMGGGFATHRRLRDWLRLLAFVLLVLALARPGYAPQRESLSQTGRDVVFALDVSQSMLAEDVAPSRLEAAKQAIRDALQTFNNERVGLVVYAGSATILCPLTYDYDFVRYMLEQAHTRSADFGGTTVQAAVEKVVGQVLMSGRGGVQDLIILTDGGDHGSIMPMVAEQLQENKVDLLLLGIGDPNTGSPIPITDSEGVVTSLRLQGAVVYTQLDDSSLRDLAALVPGAEYIPVGVRPFDLGQMYADYAMDRSVSASNVESGILVYQEAALYFIFPALLLLVLSECWGKYGLQFGRVMICLCALGFLPDMNAMDAGLTGKSAEASQLYANAEYAEAALLFADVAGGMQSSTLTLRQIAALRFNQGLCLMKLSEAESSASAISGLNYARQAQEAFLVASRASPQLQRSANRLEAVNLWMAQLQQQIDEEAKEDNALEAELQAIVERLQALLEAQQQLRQSVSDHDVDRRQPRRTRGSPPPAPIVPPEDVATNAPIFVSTQKQLESDRDAIEAAMQALNLKLTPPATEGMPAVASLLTEPIKLMANVSPAMQQAAERLAEWVSWPAAQSQQQVAEQTIEAILELLSNNSSNESEGDEASEMDEYEDYDYSDEMSESMSSSMPAEGDFAAGGEMQSLPLPNYSAEDILSEEQGNLQFRQQQRAAANAAKVEKDY